MNNKKLPQRTDVHVVLEALPSDRSDRAAGTAPVRVTVTYDGETIADDVAGPDAVLGALDKMLGTRIMGSGFSVSATVRCSAKAGTTTCRILNSIARAVSFR